MTDLNLATAATDCITKVLQEFKTSVLEKLKDPTIAKIEVVLVQGDDSASITTTASNIPLEDEQTPATEEPENEE